MLDTSKTFTEMEEAVKDVKRYIPIIIYDDFEVYYDRYYSTYFKMDYDNETYYEVVRAATLEYSTAVKVYGDIPNIGLAEFDCCGEVISDDGIEYIWFAKI